jgi:hypothetical protein
MAVARPRRHRAIIIAAALTAATALGVTISLVRQPAPAARDPRSNVKDFPRPRESTAPARAPKTAPIDRPTTDSTAADPAAASNSPRATGSPASIDPGDPGDPGAPGAGASADRDAAGSSASTDRGSAGAAARPDPRSPTDPASRSPKTPRSTAFDVHHGAGEPAIRAPGRPGNDPGHRTQRDAKTSTGSGSGSGDCAFANPHDDACRDAGAAPRP